MEYIYIGIKVCVCVCQCVCVYVSWGLVASENTHECFITAVWMPGCKKLETDQVLNVDQHIIGISLILECLLALVSADCNASLPHLAALHVSVFDNLVSPACVTL